jgi:NADPH-dependent 2,4-dienoyl-CoA reductase/sulfur reductase-like enzyme
MKASFDVVVAGAGPGGMAAAVVAAEAGKRVCLLDANPSPGGQIWRGLRAETAQHSPHGSAFSGWTARLAKSGCALWSGWQAVDVVASGCLRAESETESRDIEFERLIVATGARERFLPFPGWTLPGVMGVGGAQALVKSGLDPRGKRVVVAGSGPLLLAVAASLARAGAHIEGIFEQAPFARLAGLGLHMMFAQPGKLAEGANYRLRTLRAKYNTSAWVTRVEGHGRVERVSIASRGSERTLTCDWLACGYHLVPNLELPRLLGCNIVAGYAAVDALQQSSVPGVACIGELTGIGGLEKALVEGQIAGFAAAGREPQARSMQQQLRRQQSFARRLDRTFALREELRNLPAARTVVCRCEDITHDALASCASWRVAKLHTRCGMGPCQGRICGTAAQFLYGWSSADTRPPVYPARVSTLAATASEAGPTGR